MPAMTESKAIGVRLTPEMREALEEYCQRKSLDRSTFCRAVLMKAIGRNDLVDAMPPEGRPWPSATPEPAPKPPAKRRPRRKS